MSIMPDYASWEATLKCDLRCTHCGLSAGCQRRREMDTEESKLMFRTLAEFGVKNLVISGGEFTMRGDWEELVEYALERFDFVRLISNGRLGAEYVRILERMKHKDKLLISLSLDGTEEVHDARRGAGSFARVRDVLRAHASIPINIMTTVAKDNFDNLDDVWKFCLEYKITAWSISLGLPEGRMRREDFVGEDRLEELADKIRHYQLEGEGKIGVLPDDCYMYFHPMREPYPWTGCQGGRRLITILSDGSVTGCPTWKDKVCGNILADSLEEVWNGEQMVKLREVLEWCGKCRKCPGGCKAVQHVFGRQLCSVQETERGGQSWGW